MLLIYSDAKCTIKLYENLLKESALGSNTKHLYLTGTVCFHCKTKTKMQSSKSSLESLLHRRGLLFSFPANTALREAILTHFNTQ